MLWKLALLRKKRGQDSSKLLKIVVPFFLLQIKPISVKYGLGISDHDSEGRLVTLEFDSFYLLSAYVPNSGDGLRRLVLNLNNSVPHYFHRRMFGN